MNPIRALLWKEGRAAAPKVAAVAGLALFVGLTHFEGFPSRWWLLPLWPVCHLVGVLGSVLMGMGLVAGERSRGTLPFLSNLPVRRAWLLGVKYAVGAAGLLVVLAAYWAGVYVGMAHWGTLPSQVYVPSFEMEVLPEIGYGRILLLWFLFHLIVYSGVFLSSTLSSVPYQAAWTSLMLTLVGLFLLVNAGRLSDPVSFFLLQVLENGFYGGRILRSAFDPTLLLARAVTALLLAGCVLAWTCRALLMQGRHGLTWVTSALALICLVVQLEAWRPPPEHDSVEPVGWLAYEEGVVDLAMKGNTAMVLLTNGLSVVDVTDGQAPREIGRVELEGWRPRRLAVSGSAAYVWGWAGKLDSVGVAVLDLSRPERPRLKSQRRLHPIEAGPTRWLGHTPRLTAWTVREGYLYAGLLGREFLELHSFDVREGGLPQPVQVLRIEETTRHAWHNKWEMRLEGENAFLALGHDFVVLDLRDPAAMKELSRTSLRRFGRSRQYEELMEAFNLQLSQLPREIASEIVGNGGQLVYLARNERTMDGQRSYRISVPQPLGPVSLVGDRAYVPRYLPRELAVLDIGDPQQPVEVDYHPWPLSSQLIEDDELVYVLSPAGIRVYGVDAHGTLPPWARPRTTLQLGDESRDHMKAMSIVRAGPAIPSLLPIANALIRVDDHLCTVWANGLAIFKRPHID